MATATAFPHPVTTPANFLGGVPSWSLRLLHLVDTPTIGGTRRPCRALPFALATSSNAAFAVSSPRGHTPQPPSLPRCAFDEGTLPFFLVSVPSVRALMAPWTLFGTYTTATYFFLVAWPLMDQARGSLDPC